MSLPPAKAREAVVAALFALTSHEASQESLSLEALVQSLMHQLKITKARAKEALQRAWNVYEVREQLQAEILSTCSDYSWNRLGRIEQVVLMLCLHEMKEGEVPTKVLLAEATRLTKKFAAQTSCRFVSAVLDAICQKTQIKMEVACDPMIDQLHEAIEKGASVELESDPVQEEGSALQE